MHGNAKGVLPKFQTLCSQTVKDANIFKAERRESLLSQTQCHTRTAWHSKIMQLELQKASMPDISIALQVTDSYQPCLGVGYEAAAAGEGEERSQGMGSGPAPHPDCQVAEDAPHSRD